MKESTRKALPDSAFAYPKTRRYPIQTPKQARAALSRSAQSGTKGSYKRVAAAVRKKHGSKVASTSKKRGVVSRAGYRRKRRK